MKRIIDLTLSVLALLVFSVPMIVIGMLVRLTSNGPALYWSSRVGKNNALFSMPKFRTMRTETPAVATHLLTQPGQFLTPIGGFLRRTSLDELPQVLSIIRGDMSIVGPRPALFNQSDLIEARTKHGIDALAPGLTGWAQVNGRDELPIPVKVEYDRYYLEHRSLALDLRIIGLTAWKVIHREGVSH